MKKILKIIGFLFLFLFILFLLSIPVYLFVVQPFQNYGRSMEPTIVNQQHFLTDKISYKFSPAKRLDIIVFKRNDVGARGDVVFIARIIGLPGEEVKIRKGEVYINNQLLKEPYLAEKSKTFPEMFLKENIPATIPQDNYFVMGDNRVHSADSREYGFIPQSQIIGKLWLKY